MLWLQEAYRDIEVYALSCNSPAKGKKAIFLIVAHGKNLRNSEIKNEVFTTLNNFLLQLFPSVKYVPILEDKESCTWCITEKARYFTRIISTLKQFDIPIYTIREFAERFVSRFGGSKQQQ